MIILGERIDLSREPISQVITARDTSFIQAEAKAQVEAGATYPDVNAGSFTRKSPLPQYLRVLIILIINHKPSSPEIT
jgi:cobalamin-dependent methionine synthase I